MQSPSQQVRNIPTVPKKYAGQWIVWNEHHTEIIASGASLSVAREEAAKTGEKHVWFDKAPSEDEFFGGALFGG